MYRPADAARFNGTVVVEWLNVSGGLDGAAGWIFLHRELMREGAAYVGVSAQAVGVIGGESLMGLQGMALVEADPVRYGTLGHPGDRFSYDIYSQAGVVARGMAGTVLDDLAIERVLAIGESQSAFRLTTYVNDIDPITQVFDGYLVHARGGTAPPLDADGVAGLHEGPNVPFRDDLRVPVLCFEAETDLITLGYYPARQPDNDRFRLWEVAGLAHADVYTFVVGRIDSGALSIDELAEAWRPTDSPMGFELDHPVNVGPQRYVLSAALRRLDRWVRDGTPPPTAPRLEVDPDREPSFVLDEHGIARGGIRTPHVDVPVAVLTGEGNSGAPISRLCGRTIPFTSEQLAGLYSTRADYSAQFADGDRPCRRGRVPAGRRRRRDQCDRRAQLPRLTPTPREGSATLEGRLAGAVVEEAADTGRGVLGAEHLGEAVGFEVEPIGERAVEPAVDRTLRRCPSRPRRPSRTRPPTRVRPRAPSPAGTTRSTSPSSSASSAPCTWRPLQTSSLARAGPMRRASALRATAAREDPELDLREAEARRLARHPQVARQRKLEPAAEREAFDRSDHRPRESPRARRARPGTRR